MTAQFQDEIDFQSVRYAITAIDGHGLFDPSDHGLHPQTLSTACWRGFICTYRVEQGALLLGELEIGLSADEHPTAPRLFGCEPSRGPEKSWHPDATFYQPAAPVDFTGRLLLGADRVDGIHLNMGFRPAWLYRDVYELTFAGGGRLVGAVDRSSALAEVRDRLGARGARPRGGDEQAVRAWIDRSFSRAFDYSWPTDA